MRGHSARCLGWGFLGPFSGDTCQSNPCCPATLCGSLATGVSGGNPQAVHQRELTQSFWLGYNWAQGVAQAPGPLRPQQFNPRLAPGQAGPGPGGPRESGGGAEGLGL